MKQKIKVVLATLVGLAFVVSLIYLTYAGKKPVKQMSLITSTPQNASQNTSVFEPLTLTFSDPIVVDELSVDSEPPEDWEIKQENINTIKITHKRFLRVATPYTVNIKRGAHTLASLSFTTTAEQNDPRYLQDVQAELDRDYPLVKYTPFETSTFRVVYSAPLTLEITSKNPNIPSSEMIEEVKGWVSSKGMSVDSHKYAIAGAR